MRVSALLWCGMRKARKLRPERLLGHGVQQADIEERVQHQRVADFSCAQELGDLVDADFERVQVFADFESGFKAGFDRAGDEEVAEVVLDCGIGVSGDEFRDAAAVCERITGFFLELAERGLADFSVTRIDDTTGDF